jgi:hypothetical protein
LRKTDATSSVTNTADENRLLQVMPDAGFENRFQKYAGKAMGCTSCVTRGRLYL